jgi:hypothetical protein
MTLTAEVRARIDSMDYEALFRAWRYSPIGDPLFEGESFDYVVERMEALEVAGEDRVSVSKFIGWEREFDGLGNRIVY